MEQAEIKHIISSYYRKLNKHIQRVAVEFDAEAIHQFRVEYKKLRAFLRMLSMQDGKSGEIKVSKNLKNVYRLSGNIRDLALQQQRILEATGDEPKKPQGYLNLLQQEIEKLKPALSQCFLEGPVAESKRHTGVNIPAEFNLSGFKRYILKKWAIIHATITSGQFGDDNIHDIRKNLKDLFYNQKTCQRIDPAFVQADVWKGKEEKYISKLLEELGSFQDICTSISLLKSYWMIHLNQYNQLLLDQLKKKWIKDKISMKQLLVKQLKADFVLLKSIPKAKLSRNPPLQIGRNNP